jgi:hypothetical protein
MRHIVKIGFCIAACVAAVVARSAFAQGSIAPEYHLKTAYLFHFLEFTTWPRQVLDEAKAVVICIDDHNPWRETLLSLEKRSVHEKPIRIALLSEAAQSPCHVVVIRSDDVGLQKNFSLSSQALSLIVSDDPAVGLDRAMISLRVEDNRIVFSINNGKARAAELQISSKLLRLARTVQ